MADLGARRANEGRQKFAFQGRERRTELGGEGRRGLRHAAWLRPACAPALPGVHWHISTFWVLSLSTFFFFFSQVGVTINFPLGT